MIIQNNCCLREIEHNYPGKSLPQNYDFTLLIQLGNINFSWDTSCLEILKQRRDATIWLKMFKKQ